MSPLQRTTKKWLYGLASGFISGGASALSAGAGVSLIAPETFNFSHGLWKTFGLMLVMFLIDGFKGAALYLKQSPLPDESDTSQKVNP